MDLQYVSKKYKVQFNENDKLHEKEIVDIFENDNINYDLTNPVILNILGLYYIKKYNNYAECKKYFKMAVDLGDIDALYNLGSYYICIENNEEEMKKYWMMAIENNCPVTSYELAEYYHIKGDIDNMMHFLNISINLKSSTAMLYMAKYYCSINSINNAQKYYLMAIDNNNVKAMYQYALFCNSKLQNNDEMIKYLLMAIEYKCDKSMYFLATHYFDNNNFELAEKYYLMAVDLNCIKSMIDVAYYYKTIEKNKIKATKYLIMGINNNSDEALADLLLLYKYNKIDLYNILIKINNQFVNEIIEELLENEYIYKYLQNIEGVCFICKNVDIYVDENCCYKCYEKLLMYETKYLIKKKYYKNYENIFLGIFNTPINKINFEGKYNNEDSNVLFIIGLYYECHKKITLSIKYYMKAIELNNSNAMVKLGLLYLSHRFNNYKESIELLLKAVSLNDDDAMFNIALYYRMLNINDENIIKYYKMAIELHNNEAMIGLGNYYENIGNNEEAIKYYLKASEYKDENGLKYLRRLVQNNIDYYNLINTIKNKNYLVSYEIKKFENQKIIAKYKENINNIKNCLVCYEENIHIPFDCGHEICYRCYQQMNKCYYNC